jgi:alpha-galactosidase
MSFWCLTPSPLMLGANLPDNTSWDLGLITNDQVLALDQDPLAKPAARIDHQGGGTADRTEVWLRELDDGSRAVGMFNRDVKPAQITFTCSDARLTGKWTATDLWQHKNLGDFDLKITLSVGAHSAVLLKLKPAS